MAKVDWKDADGTVASVEERGGRRSTWYSVVFTYEVDGSWYSGTYASGQCLREGDYVPVRYDPKNPERNDLVAEDMRTRWIIALSFIVVVVIVVLCHIL